MIEASGVPLYPHRYLLAQLPLPEVAQILAHLRAVLQKLASQRRDLLPAFLCAPSVCSVSLW